jgi:Tfp pilus assembly protein PilO
MNPADGRRTIARLNYATHGVGAAVALAVVALAYLAMSEMAGYRAGLVAAHHEAEAVSRSDAEARRRHAELVGKLAEVRRRNDELRDRLTPAVGETRFVVQLADAAAATAVEIGGIHPGQKSTRDGIGQLQISLHCDGTFAGVATFLDAIQKLPRATYVSSLKIAAEEGKPALRGDLGLLLLYGSLPTEVRP